MEEEEEEEEDINIPVGLMSASGKTGNLRLNRDKSIRTEGAVRRKTGGTLLGK